MWFHCTLYMAWHSAWNFTCTYHFFHQSPCECSKINQPKKQTVIYPCPYPLLRLLQWIIAQFTFCFAWNLKYMYIHYHYFFFQCSPSECRKFNLTKLHLATPSPSILAMNHSPIYSQCTALQWLPSLIKEWFPAKPSGAPSHTIDLDNRIIG